MFCKEIRAWEVYESLDAPLRHSEAVQSVILNDNGHGLSANTYLSPGLPKSAGRSSEVAQYFSSSKNDMSPSEVYCSIL